jgi:hypothetical protein
MDIKTGRLFITLGLGLGLTLGLLWLLDCGMLGVAHAQNNSVSVNGGELAASAQSTATWNIRYVDRGESFTKMTDRSLRLDSAGNPHVAYGGTQLYHMYYTDTIWVREMVDNDYGVGEYASLAIDSAGHPHFSYYDSTNGDLRYALRVGATSYIHVFSSTGDEGAHTSLALDSADNPHISYYDITDGDLEYAHWTGSSWVTETIDSAGDVGAYTSLALDAFDNPHISYYDDTNDDLKYAYWTGSSWVTATVDSIGQVGRYTSLALDTGNQPHISYRAVGSLRYAHLTGTTWITKSLLPMASYNTSLALDASDNPRIGYHDGGLKYIQWTGTDWVVANLGEERGRYVSVALDGSDYAHISYLDLSTNPEYLGYAKQVASDTWDLFLLDWERDNVGQHTSLKVGQGDNVHISYYDASSYNRDLSYARVAMGEEHWVVVDSAGYVGTYTSLTLDQSDNPHISYIDSTNYRLKYAYWTGSGWVSQTVDPISSAGPGATSISLDGTDYPHIAYQTLGGRVRYAYWTGSEWISQTVAVGDSPSLVLDSGGVPHVSYYGSEGLCYAYLMGSTWITELVDSGESGLYTSLALDSMEYPHISYGFGPLEYAYWTGSEWNIQTVDASMDAGFYHSLALDSADSPHISYSYYFFPPPYVDEFYHLVYAHWTGSGWITQTVDDTECAGSYNSIDVDSVGNPHISYYDCSNGYLKYAKGTLSPSLPTVDFESTATSVDEGDGIATVTVTLSAESGETVTVNYATSGGTASVEEDYAVASGILTFTPGTMVQTFTVSITQDSLDEDDETVALALSDANNATIGGNNPVTLTILDDDDPPTVDFSGAAYSVNEDEGTVTIAVDLSVPSGLTVTVEYSTTDGTATAGDDYTAISGTLVLTPGVTSQSFAVAITSDEVDEDDETVILTLYNADNATIGSNNPAVLTITEEVKVYLPLVLRN